MVCNLYLESQKTGIFIFEALYFEMYGCDQYGLLGLKLSLSFGF
jgi:hypothetical protein